MKRISILIFLFSVAMLNVAVAGSKRSSQPAYVEWSDNPVLHAVPPQYTNEHAFFVCNDQMLDYRFEGRHINLYTTSHWIVKVLDQKGIEDFGENGISVNRGTRVPSIKARTILPDGKTQDIAQDMIKVTKDEYGRYRIVFAMEGLQKNAEIEVLVKEIRRGVFGSMAFQGATPVLSAHFELSSPKEMIFEERGYNGFPTVADTLINNRRHISIVQENIPALKAEPDSYYDLHRMRCEYRVQRFINDNGNDNENLYTWDDFAKNLYDEHCKLTETEKATVNHYLEDNNISASLSELQKIKKIEELIKTNILLYPFVDYDERSKVLATYDERSISKNAAGYDDTKNIIDTIIARKAATDDGFIKLFAACFAQAGVKFELGMAGDKREHGFSATFQNWANLENYLFYFPDVNKFLTPTDLYCRYPLVPTDVLGTKGVFCAIAPDGTVTDKMSDIKTINPMPPDFTQKNVDATLTFDADHNITADVVYSFSGYAGTDFRRLIADIPPDRKDQTIKEMLSLAENPDNVKEYKVKNAAVSSEFANTPVEITATIAAPQLTAIAGNDILLKIGDVIGNQGEMYTDNKRVMPVDIDYPYQLNRKITVRLPKGYKAENLDALRMHAEYVDEKLQPVVSFNSDYKLIADKKEGDLLVVNIRESYIQTHFPVTEYERFRKIFNTAADFNKVVLVLKKR